MFPCLNYDWDLWPFFFTYFQNHYLMYTYIFIQLTLVQGALRKHTLQCNCRYNNVVKWFTLPPPPKKKMLQIYSLLQFFLILYSRCVLINLNLNLLFCLILYDGLQFIIFFFRSLTRVNAAYNQIRDITGLCELHGPDGSLTHVSLHGNQLSSAEHVIECLTGLSRLNHVTFLHEQSDNPVCRMPGQYCHCGSQVLSWYISFCDSKYINQCLYIHV